MEMFSFFDKKKKGGFEPEMMPKPVSGGLGWINPHTLADGSYHMRPTFNFSIPNPIQKQDVLQKGINKGKNKNILIHAPNVDVFSFKPTAIGNQDLIPKLRVKKKSKEQYLGLKRGKEKNQFGLNLSAIGNQDMIPNLRGKKKDMSFKIGKGFGLRPSKDMNFNLGLGKGSKKSNLNIPDIGDIHFGTAKKKRKKKKKVTTDKGYKGKGLGTYSLTPAYVQKKERLEAIEEYHKKKREDLGERIEQYTDQGLLIKSKIKQLNARLKKIPITDPAHIQLLKRIEKEKIELSKQITPEYKEFKKFEAEEKKELALIKKHELKRPPVRAGLPKDEADIPGRPLTAHELDKMRIEKMKAKYEKTIRKDIKADAQRQIELGKAKVKDLKADLDLAEDEEVIESIEDQIREERKKIALARLDKTSARVQSVRAGAEAIHREVREQFPKGAGFKVVKAKKEVDVKKTVGFVFGGGTKQQKKKREAIYGGQTFITPQQSGLASKDSTSKGTKPTQVRVSRPFLGSDV